MAHAFQPLTIADYGRLYREGRCTPVEVAQRVLDASKQSEAFEPSLRIFIAQSRQDVLMQAQESADRFARGAPLGPLDGVPIAVKDEIDQTPYPTTVGTRFLGTAPATRDCTAVARLRAQGAMLIGKTNMHEIGLGVTGINPHHGPARNPYAPERMTGGSSSGSGAAVAAGLCPAAIGADGGGSGRIPAALCGVVGIKGTFGRVSEVGAYPICWSVAHIGPLAATIQDAALVLEAIAGEDEGDPNTAGQPPLGAIDGLRGNAALQGVRGLKIGWCSSWADRADAQVLRACQAAVARLVSAGAELRKVSIDQLNHVRVVQYVTIGVEMAASQYEVRREHKRDFGADVRVLLEAASQIPGVDYVRAQRLRTQIEAAFRETLNEVDVLITPTTARTAPEIRPDALKAGESDDVVLQALTEFAFVGNLTGLPAATVPVGYDGEGLPIGLQIMGRHWDEATVLRVGAAVEATTERRRPRVHYQLLEL